jgi:hypothetical protein
MANHPHPEAGDPNAESPHETTATFRPQLFVPTLQRTSLQLDIVQRYEARGFNPNGPLTASGAIAKTLLVLAQLQTYDPVILQCATAYPLRFLSSLIWTLLRVGDPVTAYLLQRKRWALPTVDRCHITGLPHAFDEKRSTDRKLVARKGSSPAALFPLSPKSVK